MKTYRGKKNYKDVGRLIEIHGEPGKYNQISIPFYSINFLTYSNWKATDIWDGAECNAYNGTDATILGPLITPEDGIVAFEPVVCRSLRTAYTKRRTTFKGIPTHIFELDLSDDTNTKACFCRNKDNCPPHGAFDLFRCTGKTDSVFFLLIEISIQEPNSHLFFFFKFFVAVEGIPMIATLPHFYKAEQLLDGIESGLNPNKTFHELYIYLEIVSL